MDVNGDHETERELPAPERPVKTDGHRHGKQCAHLRQTQQQELGFGQKEQRGKLKFGDERRRDAEDAQDARPKRFRAARWRGFHELCGLRRGVGNGAFSAAFTEIIDLAQHHRLLARTLWQQRVRLSPGAQAIGRLNRGGGFIGQPL